MLITFGTPYRGSLNALNFLANGFSKKIGPFKVADLSELLRSLTSVYQLLPIYPCIDTGTGQLSRVAETDVLPAGIDATRTNAAEYQFRRAIEAAIAARGQQDPYLIYPVVGLTQPTLQSARLAAGQLATLHSYEGEELDGDGTVSSAASPTSTPAVDRYLHALSRRQRASQASTLWRAGQGDGCGWRVRLRTARGACPQAVSRVGSVRG